MPPQTNLEQSIDIIQNRLSAVVLSYMQTAGKRLKDISEIEDLQTYLYSAEFLDDTGKDLRKVQRELNKTHKQNLHDINSLFKTVTAEAYSTGKEMAERKDTRLSPLTSYRQEASPLLRQVVRDYEVMSRSTTLNETYKKTIRQYVNRLTMGDEDNAPTAMRKAIRELTAQGISTIDYRSGRHIRMDTAVRRDLMNEYTNIVQSVNNKLGQELNASAVEISGHQHPAVDHEPIQGRIFTLEEFEKLQNGEEARDVDIEKYEAGEADYLGETFQTDRPIGMWNCRHIYFSFILGVSIPSFSKDELEAMQERNEDGIEFHGKHYTLYEGEQQQRALELNMRKERENLNLLKEVRETSPQAEHDYQKSKARLAELRNEYKELGAALEPKALRMKWDRSYIPKGSIGDLGSLAAPRGSTPVIMGDNIAKPLGEDFARELQYKMSNAPQEMQDAWNNLSGEVKIIDTAYKGTPHYSHSKKGILFDAEEDKSLRRVESEKVSYYRPPHSVAFHEMLHNMSKAAAERSGNSPLVDYSDVFKSKNHNSMTFTQMLEKEYKEFYDKAKGILKDSGKPTKAADIYQFMNKQLESIGSKGIDVSDLLEGLSKGKVGGHNNGMFGHGNDYWKNHTVGTEGLAEFGSATITNPESLSVIKLIFPKSYDIFIEMVISMGRI